MMLEALMMVPSLAVGLLYRESWQLLVAFLLPMAVLLVSGLALSFRAPANRSIFALEGLWWYHCPGLRYRCSDVSLSC